MKTKNCCVCICCQKVIPSPLDGFIIEGAVLPADPEMYPPPCGKIRTKSKGPLMLSRQDDDGNWAYREAYCKKCTAKILGFEDLYE